MGYMSKYYVELRGGGGGGYTTDLVLLHHATEACKSRNGALHGGGCHVSEKKALRNV